MLEKIKIDTDTEMDRLNGYGRSFLDFSESRFVEEV